MANRTTTPKTQAQTKKVCFYCASEGKFVPSYTDVVTLRKFMTDRGKIIPKQRNGNCAKHQRRVTKQIKYARHLALLPFTVQV